MSKNNNQEKWTSRLFIEFLLIVLLFAGLFGLAALYVTSGLHLYNISNYALAVALGFASVCFSWARAETDDRAISNIMFSGRSFVIVAALLIAASLSDYIATTIHGKTFKIVLNVFFGFSFGFGVLFFLSGLLHVLKAINKTQWKKEEKAEEEKAGR